MTDISIVKSHVKRKKNENDINIQILPSFHYLCVNFLFEKKNHYIS